MSVKDVVVFLDKLGMWDIIVPFILVFTIVYAVLDKTKVLGEEDGEPKRRFNAIAAFVIASFTLLAVDVMNLVTRMSQYMVMLLVMGLLLAVLFGFLGFKDLGKKKLGKKIILPVAFACLILVMLYAFGWLDILDWSAVYRYSGVLIALAVFFVVIWLILREPKKEEAQKTTPSSKPEEKKSEERTPRTVRGMAPESFLNVAQDLPESMQDDIARSLESAITETNQGRMVDIDAIFDNVSDDTKKELKKRIQFK